MIRVTGFKWVPPFAQGQVRDLRVRWTLGEVGLAYETRLIDAAMQRSAAYRAEQPFGQVPVLEMDGETIFESGAILLAIAEKVGVLLGESAAERARILCWYFAALNSVEPALMNVAEADFFISNEDEKARRRTRVGKFARLRLGELDTALGDRDYLVERFSLADLMMSSVLRIVGHTDLLDRTPRLVAYKARCEARPAFQSALAHQLADFAAHDVEDMQYRSA